MESHEQVQAPSNRPGKQLWLLQLPAEVWLSPVTDLHDLEHSAVPSICRLYAMSCMTQTVSMIQSFLEVLLLFAAARFVSWLDLGCQDHS